MTSSPAKKWTVVSERHRKSVDAFVGAASLIDGDGWSTPIADGKWTPAQITQHVTQTYEVMTRQLRTGEGLRIQTGWFMRQVLRVAVLRPIMWTRRLPSGAKAPRVLRPVDDMPSQHEAIERLRDAVRDLETELLARREEKGLQLTHHIFGSFDARMALDFIAVHTEHHGRQLEAIAE